VRIDFEERDLAARVPTQSLRIWSDPAALAADPLTGASARILTGSSSSPRTDPTWRNLPRSRLLPVRHRAPRDGDVPFPLSWRRRPHRLGKAVAVPNILAYATHSAVGIYDPGRHFLDLDHLTPSLVGTPGRHDPPCHAVRRLDRRPCGVRQRQSPAARRRLAGSSAPSVRSRFLRPDRPARSGRAVESLERTARVLLGGPAGSGAGGPRWVGQTGRVAGSRLCAERVHEVWAW